MQTTVQERADKVFNDNLGKPLGEFLEAIRAGFREERRLAFLAVAAECNERAGAAEERELRAEVADEPLWVSFHDGAADALTTLAADLQRQAGGG